MRTNTILLKFMWIHVCRLMVVYKSSPANLQLTWDSRVQTTQLLPRMTVHCFDRDFNSYFRLYIFVRVVPPVLPPEHGSEIVECEKVVFVNYFSVLFLTLWVFTGNTFCGQYNVRSFWNLGKTRYNIAFILVGNAKIHIMQLNKKL